MRAIPERLRDASCGGAIQIDYRYLYLFNSPACPSIIGAVNDNVAAEGAEQVMEIHSNAKASVFTSFVKTKTF